MVFQRELDSKCDVHHSHYGRMCPIETQRMILVL
ncbi:MAG: hypothetical protein ACLR6T_00395 [Intestinibacter sp.]